MALSKSPGASQITCTQVWNNNSANYHWNNSEIGAGNYTCNQAGISLTVDGNTIGSGDFNVSSPTINVSYTYKDASADINTTRNSERGMMELADQGGNMGTIVAILFIISLLSTLLFAYFRR